ncbi:MAG: hypothetical protein J6T32_04595 [Paludibacteraceae bacterium]|nr:hypothetical protein [Paludibacteraceae bacterium]
MRKILYFAFAAVLAVAFASCEKKSNSESGENTAAWINPNSQNGLMLHKFSVADTRTVRFSQGNLQYRASTGTWRFAPNQWEMIGGDNSNRSMDYNGWIDLFSWGATGYNGRLPHVVPSSSGDFQEPQGSIANTDYDWGYYLSIVNGGNQKNLWRTLTDKEWEYLFHGRTNAEQRFGFATVNDVEGLILLPDDWENPTEVLGFTASTDKGLNWESDFGSYQDRTKTVHYLDNNYTATQWKAMEKAGAIFLPAAGGYSNDTYFNKNINSDYNRGGYWSATRKNDNQVYVLDFYSNPTGTHTFLAPSTNTTHVQFGEAVRLVR